MAERLFHFSDGTSNKFWAIAVSGTDHTVRYGKLGSTGQSKTKTFASANAAQNDADKLIAEKTGKGYVEQSAIAGPTGPEPEAPPISPPPAASVPVVVAPLTDTPLSVLEDLAHAFQRIKSATFPDWLPVSQLPPILVQGSPLTPEQVLALLSIIKKEGLTAQAGVVAHLKSRVESRVLNAFAWAVYEAWERAGYPTKEKWAFWTLGRLGNDESALAITPSIREWPGQSQHGRAVLGLEVLRCIGTDTAIMQLNGIAQKVKFQGLKNKAREMMEAIAKDRGLTRAELEDRIVPDLGLDARGSRTLDFGPRQFRVALGPDLSPQVRDGDGKLRADLPKPGSKDDTAKAMAAVEAWKLLKKQLREALRIQGPRLEQAMVTGRKWPLADFLALLVNHPLMTNLAQRLVWAAYDGSGTRLRTFRVTEEKLFTDQTDSAVSLADATAVGIVHPMNLSASESQTWGQVLSDYEIVSPFLQLGRPTFTVNPERAKEKSIRDFAEIGLHPGSIWSGTERLGWIRGSSADHGVVMEFSKPFPEGQVTALIRIEPGIARGAIDMLGDAQKIVECCFLRGVYETEAYPYHRDEHKLPLGQVNPIAYSEVMADLNALASKARD